MEMFKRGLPHTAYVVRKEAKDHGAGNKIEGLNFTPKGSTLVVIEDSVTTGSSALKAVEAVKKAGFEVDGILAIVDRCEGGSGRFKEAGIDKFYSLFQLSELKT
jgi:orotate phosphoribosyltransferase